MSIRYAIIACLAATILPASTLHASTLSERVYRELTELHGVLEADRGDEALRGAERLLQRKISKHERAQVLLLKIDILLGMERYENAITMIRQVIASNAVPKARREQLHYNLGQLYSQVGRWRDAIRVLEAWLREATEPPANAYFVLAACQMELDNLGEARRWADRGRMATTKLTYPQYQFLASVYAQQSDWPVLQTLLQEAIEAFWSAAWNPRRWPCCAWLMPMAS